MHIEGQPRGPKAWVKALLERFGYRIERLSQDDLRYRRGGHDDSTPLPPGAEAELRPDNPRLQELKRRYAAVDSPVCAHTLWSVEMDDATLDLRWFRGDNAYVWQYRSVREQARFKYYLYTQYIAGLDTRGLLGTTLTEDGAFGCFVFKHHELPSASRDLLDSVNELYFLDRHWNLFGRRNVRVLDIGAGYGRLAHRMLAAAPGVERYWCIDAIPRSTFLCEWYLRYRGCLDRATVVPLDEMETALSKGMVDLAMNIHSFSEMSYAAIEGWISWLARLEVPALLILPNDPQRLQSLEADGSKRDIDGLLAQHGYRLKVRESTVRNADLRELMGIDEHFFLFERV
ncbi:MAG TPA: putative sugar O-methyltransferase [Nevskia sp.]|nr:putative sugar O-methyltransferase [Nevskia sp.]